MVEVNKGCNPHDPDCYRIKIRRKDGRLQYYWVKVKDLNNFLRMKRSEEGAEIVGSDKYSNELREGIPEELKQYIEINNPIWGGNVIYGGMRKFSLMNLDNMFYIIRIGRIIYFINANDMPSRIGEKIDRSYKMLVSFAPEDEVIKVYFMGRTRFGMKINGVRSEMEVLGNVIRIYGDRFDERMFLYVIAGMMGYYVGKGRDDEWIKKYGDMIYYLKVGNFREAGKIFEEKEIKEFEGHYPYYVRMYVKGIEKEDRCGEGVPGCIKVKIRRKDGVVQGYWIRESNLEEFIEEHRRKGDEILGEEGEGRGVVSELKYKALMLSKMFKDGVFEAVKNIYGEVVERNIDVFSESLESVKEGIEQSIIDGNVWISFERIFDTLESALIRIGAVKRKSMDDIPSYIKGKIEDMLENFDFMDEDEQKKVLEEVWELYKKMIKDKVRIQISYFDRVYGDKNMGLAYSVMRFWTSEHYWLFSGWIEEWMWGETHRTKYFNPIKMINEITGENFTVEDFKEGLKRYKEKIVNEVMNNVAKETGRKFVFRGTNEKESEQMKDQIMKVLVWDEMNFKDGWFDMDVELENVHVDSFSFDEGVAEGFGWQGSGLVIAIPFEEVKNDIYGGYVNASIEDEAELIVQKDKFKTNMVKIVDAGRIFGNALLKYGKMNVFDNFKRYIKSISYGSAEAKKFDNIMSFYYMVKEKLSDEERQWLLDNAFDIFCNAIEEWDDVTIKAIEKHLFIDLDDIRERFYDMSDEELYEEFKEGLEW